VQGAEPGEVLFGGEQVLDAGGVADPQQVAGQGVALLGQWLAAQQDLPGGRLHQPGQQAQQAGLAAAVGAADLQHVAGRSSKSRCSNSRRQSRSQARPAAWR
jgi:hypothetical protein